VIAQFQFQPQRMIAAHSQRQGGDTGTLRVLLLAFALAMPLGAMAYLQIPQTRLSYAMSEIRGQMNAEEELRRTLMLERSYYQRSEAVKEFADQSGMEPRKLPN
jgi:hypothetical protein